MTWKLHNWWNSCFLLCFQIHVCIRGALIYTKNFSQLQSCCRLFLSLSNDFLITEDQKGPLSVFSDKSSLWYCGSTASTASSGWFCSQLGSSGVFLIQAGCRCLNQSGSSHGPLLWLWAEILGSLIASTNLIFNLALPFRGALLKFGPWYCS